MSNEFAATPELAWEAEAGVSYTIEASTNLAEPESWHATAVAIKSSTGPIKWMAPESIRETRFYRLVTRPAISDVQPAFVSSDDTNAFLYFTGQLLPTNASVVINGQSFALEKIGEGNFGSVFRTSLNGLPPGEPVIGTLTVIDLGTSNVITTLPIQSPIFYGTSMTQEQLQGPPEEPPASPQALIAIWATKKGYDYYKANSDMSAAGAVNNPYFQSNQNAGEMPERAMRRGYDYYMAKHKANMSDVQSNPMYQERRHATTGDPYPDPPNCCGHALGWAHDDEAPKAMITIENSLLLPTLMKAKEKANRSKCGNSLRVMPATGEVQAEETDLAIPGAMLDFAWTRTYRSRTGPTTAQGAGWDFSFNVSLTQNGDGTVTLRPGNGRADTFYPAGTNGWFRDEYFCQIVDLNGDSFPDVRFADTSRWIFNPLGTAAGGKLAQIIDRNGNTISLGYNPKGQLATIVDDVGRTNTVTFNGKNQISGVTDFTGRNVKYEYDGNGDLVSVISPAVTGTPTGNDFPGGITNHYTYSSGYANAAENHLLLAVIDGKGQLQYDHVYQHNQTDLEFLRCISVQEGTNPPTQYRYFPHAVNPAQHFSATRSLVNDPVGNVSELEFDSRGRCVSLREFTGRAVPGVPVTDTVNRPTGKLRGDDPDYFETQWTWNADSLCTSEILPDGEVTEYTYQRAFNQNSARSNHGPSLGPIDDSLHNGDLRVVRALAAPGSGADLDGDGALDVTELSWHFDYDPRFGSPATARKVHGVHHGDNQPMARGCCHAVSGDSGSINAGSYPLVVHAHCTGGSFRGPRQTVSLNGSYAPDIKDRFGRPAINTALNSGTRAINTKGSGAIVRFSGGGCKAGSTEVVLDSAEMFKFGVSATDPRGNATLAEYDSSGNCLRMRKRPEILYQAWDETIQDYVYNSHGQLTTVTNAVDANGQRRVDKINYYASGSQAGQVQSIAIDEPGVQITSTFEYDAVGNLTRCVDPRTNDWLFTYNALDQCVRVQTPTNLTARSKTDFIYDANGNVPDAIEELRDDSDAFVRNVTTHCDFDLLDSCTALVAQVSPGVFITNRFSYDGNGQLTLVESPLAVSGVDPHAATQFRYDERGLLYRSVTTPGSPLQNTTQYDYDSAGLLTRISDGLESTPAVTALEYDGFATAWVETVWNKQCVEKDTVVRLADQDYNIKRGLGLRRVTDPMGNVTTFNYDRNGNCTLVRCFGETNDVPGSAGNLLLAESSYSYDSLNRLTQSRDKHTSIVGQAIGDGYRTMIFAYAPNSDCTGITDDNSHTTRYAYDTAGRLSSVTDPKTNVVSFGYDAGGNVTTLTSTEKSDLTPGTPQVFTLRCEYDPLNRQVSVADNVGNTNRCAYDSLGRNPFVNTAAGEICWLDHDDLGRCVAEQADLDGDGLREVTDPARAWAYDVNSRCVAAADPNSNVTRYAYDSQDRCVTVTNADLTTVKLIWSPRSNLLISEDGNGTIITNTYDLNDRIIHRDIAARNILVARTTTFETFAYDGLSQLVAATNDVSHDEFTYDTLGYCNSSRRDGWLMGHLHDAVGNELALTYPDGLVVSYSYDANDEVTSVSTTSGGLPPTTQATMDYEGPGRIGRITRANGVNTRLVWDGLQNPGNASGDFGWRQVSGINHQITGGGAVIDRRSAKYDRKQNRTQRAQLTPFFTGGPLRTNTFGYDALNRLKDSDRNILNTIRVYDLDANGNRLSVSSNGVAEVYAMDNTLPSPADFQMNQYTLTPFGQQTFDDNGNLLSRSSLAGEAFYQYDYADRLVGVSAFDNGSGTVVPVASYAYGPLGERISKTVYSTSPITPPTVTRFVYGKEGQRVRQTRDENGAVGNTYVGTCDAGAGDCDDIMMLPAGGSPLYFHTDDLGNVLALTGPAGSVIERYDYDDFGQPQFLTTDGFPLATTVSPLGNPFLFHGMEWDSETGFYHGGNGDCFDPQTAKGINGINSGGMPNRISMNVTVPKQTQGATFGEKVASGLHAAGSVVSQGVSRSTGVSLNPWSHGGSPVPLSFTRARELIQRERLMATGHLLARREIRAD